ncbi:MAG: AraC family transcriptional regulator [Lentisphaerota bacterium]
MTSEASPFALKPGRGGVIVRFADKRWYLREWHSHEALEINLVLRGSGSVLLEDRRYPLLPGHLIWLWPGQRHMPARWSSDMLMWIIEWQPAFLGRLKKARSGKGLRPGDPRGFFCRRVDSQSLQRLEGILSGTAGMEETDTFNEGLYFAMLALWDEFIRAQPVASEAFLHPKLEQVLNLLNTSTEDTRLEDLARAVKISPYYLSVLFREQTGLSLPDYRNRQRLNQFFNLYRARPEIRILELALEAGFGSYAQFFRVFTEHIGQPPKAWLRGEKTR